MWDLTYADLNQLPTLRAFVRETLRMSPPFSSVLPRVVGPGTEAVIPGLRRPLPPGTLVACNLAVITHSKAVFGADADEFKPDRWLQPHDEEKRRQMEDAWAIFGRGSRGCLGRDLAHMIIYKIVAAVRLVFGHVLALIPCGN